MRDSLLGSVHSSCFGWIAAILVVRHAFSVRIMRREINRPSFPFPQESRVKLFNEWMITTFHSIVMMREQYRDVDEFECMWKIWKSRSYSEDEIVKLYKRIENDMCCRFLKLGLWEGIEDRRKLVINECELMWLVHGYSTEWNDCIWMILFLETGVGLIGASVWMWLMVFSAVLLVMYRMCNKQGT